MTPAPATTITTTTTTFGTRTSLPLDIVTRHDGHWTRFWLFLVVSAENAANSLGAVDVFAGVSADAVLLCRCLVLILSDHSSGSV